MRRESGRRRQLNIRSSITRPTKPKEPSISAWGSAWAAWRTIRLIPSGRARSRSAEQIRRYQAMDGHKQSNKSYLTGDTYKALKDAKKLIAYEESFLNNAKRGASVRYGREQIADPRHWRRSAA